MTKKSAAKANANVNRFHPVFEKNVTNEERADWNEARFFAEELVESAQAAFAYTNGEAADPGTAFTALRQALRLASAFERALARRHTRLTIERTNKG